MARSDPQLNFRCPPELKDQLEEAARKSGRSLTMELVYRLEESFALDQRVKSIARQESNILEAKSVYRTVLERMMDMAEYYRLAVMRDHKDDNKEEMAALKSKMEADTELFDKMAQKYDKP
jgi:hypothetical protein